MTRLLLSTLVALCMWALLDHRVDAQPSAPADCTLHPRFAAFQETATAHLVGVCREPETTDDRGRMQQRTSRGRLYLDPTNDLVSFRGGGSLLSEGPGGLGSDVIVDGLSDRLTSREPMHTSALSMLTYAMIRPEHLGEGWRIGTAPTMHYVADVPPCAVEPQMMVYGDITTNLVHTDTRRTVGQSLTAFSAPQSWTFRQEMERSLSTCFERTLHAGDHTFRLTPSFEELGPLGSESFTVRVDWLEAETGAAHVTRLAAVRYGGLLMTIQATVHTEEPIDDAHEAAETGRLVKVAHERVQHAAWYLRG